VSATNAAGPARGLRGARDWPEFTDDDIRHIDAWLPEEADPRRRKLLPQILREWAWVEIREYFAWEPAKAARERRGRLTQLGKIADRLLEELDGLDEHDRLTLAGQIGASEGQEVLEAIFNEENHERLADARNFIATLAAAAKRPLQESRPGRPRNISAYRVMMDIAAIFEYLTDMEATRQVDRNTHEEKGPFREFAGAIWPILFTSDDGLSAALKTWAGGKKKHAESSPLIANIDMRHPEWGLF
jgi:hypothetical protein